MKQEPIWVVQNNGIDRVTASVAKTLREQGRTMVDVSVHETALVQEVITQRLHEEGLELSSERALFFFGSVLLLNGVHCSEQYRPYSWVTQEHYHADCWIEKLGDQMLNDRIEVMLLRDVWKQFGDLFVRPAQEQKLFTGVVLNEQTRDAWFEKEQRRNPTLNELSVVNVSTPKPIQAEWRVLCFNRKPKLWSQYKKDDRLHVEPTMPPAVLNFANQIAQQWVPDPMCTLDIAQTENGLRVVEFNGIHCCGLYAIDRTQFINEVNSVILNTQKK